jgi:hypothetical protein
VSSREGRWRIRCSEFVFLYGENREKNSLWGGNCRHSVGDSQKVAEGRIERKQPGIFSADETAVVGIDLGTPVVEAIGAEAKSRFTGRIPKLTVEVREAAQPAAAKA